MFVLPQVMFLALIPSRWHLYLYMSLVFAFTSLALYPVAWFFLTLDFDGHGVIRKVFKSCLGLLYDCWRDVQHGYWVFQRVLLSVLCSSRRRRRASTGLPPGDTIPNAFFEYIYDVIFNSILRVRRLYCLDHDQPLLAPPAPANPEHHDREALRQEKRRTWRLREENDRLQVELHVLKQAQRSKEVEFERNLANAAAARATEDAECWQQYMRKMVELKHRVKHREIQLLQSIETVQALEADIKLLNAEHVKRETNSQRCIAVLEANLKFAQNYPGLAEFAVTSKHLTSSSKSPSEDPHSPSLPQSDCSPEDTSLPVSSNSVASNRPPTRRLRLLGLTQAPAPSRSAINSTPPSPHFLVTDGSRLSSRQTPLAPSPRHSIFEDTKKSPIRSFGSAMESLPTNRPLEECERLVTPLESPVDFRLVPLSFERSEVHSVADSEKTEPGQSTGGSVVEDSLPKNTQLSSLSTISRDSVSVRKVVQEGMRHLRTLTASSPLPTPNATNLSGTKVKAPTNVVEPRRGSPLRNSQPPTSASTASNVAGVERLAAYSKGKGVDPREYGATTSKRVSTTQPLEPVQRRHVTREAMRIEELCMDDQSPLHYLDRAPLLTRMSNPLLTLQDAPSSGLSPAPAQRRIVPAHPHLHQLRTEPAPRLVESAEDQRFWRRKVFPNPQSSCLASGPRAHTDGVDLSPRPNQANVNPQATNDVLTIKRSLALSAWKAFRKPRVVEKLQSPDPPADSDFLSQLPPRPFPPVCSVIDQRRERETSAPHIEDKTETSKRTSDSFLKRSNSQDLSTTVPAQTVANPSPRRNESIGPSSYSVDSSTLEAEVLSPSVHGRVHPSAPTLHGEPEPGHQQRSPQITPKAASRLYPVPQRIDDIFDTVGPSSIIPQGSTPIPGSAHGRIPFVSAMTTEEVHGVPFSTAPCTTIWNDPLVDPQSTNGLRPAASSSCGLPGPRSLADRIAESRGGRPEDMPFNLPRLDATSTVLVPSRAREEEPNIAGFEGLFLGADDSLQRVSRLEGTEPWNLDSQSLRHTCLAPDTSHQEAQPVTTLDDDISDPPSNLTTGLRDFINSSGGGSARRRHLDAAIADACWPSPYCINQSSPPTTPDSRPASARLSIPLPSTPRSQASDVRRTMDNKTDEHLIGRAPEQPQQSVTCTPLAGLTLVASIPAISVSQPSPPARTRPHLVPQRQDDLFDLEPRSTLAIPNQVTSPNSSGISDINGDVSEGSAINRKSTLSIDFEGPVATSTPQQVFEPRSCGPKARPINLAQGMEYPRRGLVNVPLAASTPRDSRGPGGSSLSSSDQQSPENATRDQLEGASNTSSPFGRSSDDTVTILAHSLGLHPFHRRIYRERMEYLTAPDVASNLRLDDSQGELFLLMPQTMDGSSSWSRISASGSSRGEAPMASPQSHGEEAASSDMSMTSTLSNRLFLNSESMDTSFNPISPPVVPFNTPLAVALDFDDMQQWSLLSADQTPLGSRMWDTSHGTLTGDASIRRFASIPRHYLPPTDSELSSPSSDTPDA